MIQADGVAKTTPQPAQCQEHSESFMQRDAKPD
jgi:hypothetical protein